MGRTPTCAVVDVTVDVDAVGPASRLRIDLGRTLTCAVVDVAVDLGLHAGDATDADVDVDAEASELRQFSTLWFVPSLDDVEAALTGRAVDVEAIAAIAVRIGVGWPYRISTVGGRTGAAGRAGAGG